MVAEDARFDAQSEPIANIDTVLDYCDWMQAVGQGPLAGCEYEIDNSSFDEATSTAMFFSLFTATNGGEGGPIPRQEKVQSRTMFIQLR